MEKIVFLFLKIIRVGVLISLALFSFYLLGQSLQVETKSEDLTQKANSKTSSVEESTNWEEELEQEIAEQESKEQSSQGNRGTSSPVQNKNQINRSAQNLMMDVSVALDIVGAWDNKKPRGTSERINNKLDVRTAEFGFSGAVDQWLRANFLAAAHGENGEYFYEVHEAWIQFPFLPLNTSLKVGQMFMDIGRLNKIHSHDRAFTMAPLVHEKFIGWESTFDTGAEFSILFPWTKITQELVLGVTNGKKWGHGHTEGEAKNNPLSYFHLKHFYYFGNNWGTQFGASGVRFEPTTDRRNQRYLYGLDGILRWNRSNLREVMFLSEFWYQQEFFPDTIDPATYISKKTSSNDKWGYYVFAEYKFHQLWSVGFRYDYLTDKSLVNADGSPAKNAIEAQSLQMTFHSSEFGKIRGSLERRYIQDFSKEDFQEVREYRMYIQMVAILGSHPAHSY